AYAGRYDFGPPTELGDMRNGGIGVNMAAEKGGAKVLKVLDGAPAARAGVAAGDVITHVDDAPLAGLSLYQMIGRLRGPVGSPARLQIKRKEAAQPDIAPDIAIVRAAGRALIDVRVEGGRLVVEAVGGAPVFEFEVGKRVVIAPLSEQAFYVDGRYHTEI